MRLLHIQEVLMSNILGMLSNFPLQVVTWKDRISVYRELRHFTEYEEKNWNNLVTPKIGMIQTFTL